MSTAAYPELREKLISQQRTIHALKRGALRMFDACGKVCEDGGMEAGGCRVPRDVVVHLFRRAQSEPLLMLRRTRQRGGFWQGVSGAPLAGESDRDAAVREVREETGFEVAETLFSLDVTYSYCLDPAQQERWRRIYGPGVETIHVNSFAAEIPAGVPPLDPDEHDGFSWCSFEEAYEMLNWPVKPDTLSDRRLAIKRARDRIADLAP